MCVSAADARAGLKAGACSRVALSHGPVGEVSTVTEKESSLEGRLLFCGVHDDDGREGGSGS